MGRRILYWIVTMVAVVLVSGIAHRAQASGIVPSPATQHASAESIQTNAIYTGEVFLDVNMNGVREFQEQGVSNIEVVVETLAGEVVAQTLSDEEGHYLFAELPLDDLRVRVVPPAHYQVTANGTYTFSTRSPHGAVSPSTGLSLGVYLPMIQQW